MAKTKKTMGRPTLINEKVVAGLEKDIALGMTWQMACAGQGVDYYTVRNWINQDEKAPGQPKYFNIYRRCIDAKEKAKAYALLCWRKAFPDDWRACHKFLACMDRETFSERYYLEHGGKVEVHNTLEHVPVANLKKARELLTAKAGSAPATNGRNNGKH